jgi:predicted SAM-dependent methyltransferase
VTDVNLDLGCGNAKRDGYLGLDYVEGPQVDFVLDLTNDRYPFDDASVDKVFSAHFLEHIDEPNHVFSEIGRICRDGAAIEFWTPYAFSNEAFLYGHTHFLTEKPWMHFCVSHRDVFAEMLRGRWLLKSIDFVVGPETEAELRRYGVPMDFAVKYLKGVVQEFGVEIEFQRDLATPVSMPTQTWSTTRFGERQPLEPDLPANRSTGFGHRVHHGIRKRLLGRDLAGVFRHVNL